MPTLMFTLSLILVAGSGANAADREQQCRAALEEADRLAATLYVDQTRLAKARERAFDICNSMTVDSLLRARAFEHEASRLSLAGSRPLALPLLESAADQMRATDPESEGLVILLDALLPYVGRARGHGAVLTITKEALEVRRKVYPEISEQVARGILYVGMAQEGVGNLDAAEDSFREAARIANECCAPRNQVLAVACNFLADLLVRKGRDAEAAEFEEKAASALPSLE